MGHKKKTFMRGNLRLFLPAGAGGCLAEPRSRWLVLCPVAENVKSALFFRIPVDQVYILFIYKWEQIVSIKVIKPKQVTWEKSTFS